MAETVQVSAERLAALEAEHETLTALWRFEIAEDAKVFRAQLEDDAFRSDGFGDHARRALSVVRAMERVEAMARPAEEAGRDATGDARR